MTDDKEHEERIEDILCMINIAKRIQYCICHDFYGKNPADDIKLTDDNLRWRACVKEDCKYLTKKLYLMFNKELEKQLNGQGIEEYLRGSYG